MKKEELNNKYGLYKSLDLEKDERINIFCKAGGGFIYFAMLVVGYFLSNQTLFFKGPDVNPYLWLQLLLLVVVFIAYNYLHEIVHLIAAKIKKANCKWNREGISSYLSLENQLLDNKTYYFIIFAPVIVFTIILIPLQILVAIFAFDWFWLVWIAIIQNYASSIGDIVAYFMTRKFKNAYLEDSNLKISIYVEKDKFAYYQSMEKEIFNKKAKKAQKKKNRKGKFKRLKKAAEEKYDADLKKKYNIKEQEQDQDIEDLSKLDM